jgi:hypothetical protein
MAMNRFPNDVRSWAYAPTIFPHTVLPGDTLFYRTMVNRAFGMSFPGRKVAYIVWFNDKRGKMVAQFQGTQFDTAAHANSAILGGFGDVFGVAGRKSDISLDTGLSGTAVVDTERNEAHILWSEGRWKINATSVGTTQPPITTANEVVAYLHTHFLPVPNTLGEIAVTTNAETSTATMTWQEGNLMFAVSTGEAAKQPIETALALAIAMKKYQWSELWGLLGIPPQQVRISKVAVVTPDFADDEKRGGDPCASPPFSSSNSTMISLDPCTETTFPHIRWTRLLE